MPSLSADDFGQLVGAWTLESAVAVDEGGRVSQPFGAEPQGVLLYTPDMWVSATITSVGPDDSDGPCFYAGPVEFAGDHIEHRVAVGAAPFSPGTVQSRGVQVESERLQLT